MQEKNIRRTNFTWIYHDRTNWKNRKENIKDELIYI